MNVPLPVTVVVKYIMGKKQNKTKDAFTDNFFDHWMEKFCVSYQLK